MSERAERCGGCRWYDPSRQYEMTGFCRRYPTSATPSHTNEDEWCGEFAPRDKRVADNRDQWEKGP